MKVAQNKLFVFRITQTPNLLSLNRHSHDVAAIAHGSHHCDWAIAAHRRDGDAGILKDGEVFIVLSKDLPETSCALCTGVS